MVLTKLRYFGILKFGDFCKAAELGRFLFFRKFQKFTINVAYGEMKTSIIRKMSHSRAKRNEIWDSWVVIQHM